MQVLHARRALRVAIRLLERVGEGAKFRCRIDSTCAIASVVYPIGSMYGIYAHIWGIFMVNVTIYGIHGSYGYVNAKKIFVAYGWSSPQKLL